MGKVNMNIDDELELDNEVIEPEIKRVTLHPLTADGEIDLDVNLYPKTLVDGVVDRQGLPVDIATQDELDEAAIHLDNKKQDVIPDLGEIRSKANSAVQPEDLATVATTGSYHDLVDKPIIPEIPVADVLVNGESVVNEETVAEINLKTINDEPIEGEGNFELATTEDLDNYYTKEEVDETTNALDKRVEILEDQAIFYDYYYSQDEEAHLPVEKTTYNFLEFSSKDATLDHIYDCSIEIRPGEEPEVNLVKDDNYEYLGKLFTTENSFKLYQTGSKADIATNNYAYDTIELASEKIIRYCYPITFETLFTLIPSTSIAWNKSAGGGRLSINYGLLADKGIYVSEGFVVKTTENIGLTYTGVGASNFGINGLFDTFGVENKADAISLLTGDNYKDIQLIFKRVTPVEDSLVSISSNILSVLCDGDKEAFVSAQTNFCLKCSHVSLSDLVYSKDQCDAKFQTIADFEAKFNPNQYILKVGDTTIDPTSREYNKLEATLQVYSTVLKEAGYPKYACALCVEPSDQALGVAPYRGDTTFINAKNGDTFGYLVLSQGITYWVTKTKINGIDTDVVKQISLGPDQIIIDSINNDNVWINCDVQVHSITTNTLLDSENQSPIISFNEDNYYATIGQVGKIEAPSASNDFTILQVENHNNPEIIDSAGDVVRVMNLADPINDRDAANKQYVDNKEVSWDEITNKPADNSNLRNSMAAGSLFQVAQFKEGLTWESDDTSVATVDENGHVEAISTGSAIISVMDEDGRTAECTVNVSAPVGRSLRKGALRTATNTWKLVTDASTLVAGQQVIVAASSYAFALSTEQKTSNRGQAAITKNAGDTITWDSSLTNPPQTLTLGSQNNYWTLYTGSGYLYAASSSGNQLKTRSSAGDDNGEWTISISGNIASIAAHGDNRGVMQYNASGLFSCYSGASQQPLALYRKVELVESIEILNNPGTLTVGSTHQLNTSILPAIASDKSLTWHTSDDTIISVSSTGLLTAESLGTATIYAEANDGSKIRSNSITITVKEQTVVRSITAEATPSSGVYTNVLALKAYVDGDGDGHNVVNWSIDDPDIATIASTGADTATATLARNIGTATVTATSAVEGFESISGSCTITNNQIYISEVTIDPATETDLTVGLVYPINYTIEPEFPTYSTVLVSSNNPNIVTVEGGQMYALSAGEATITATAADGNPEVVEDSITVTVREPLGSLYLDKDELRLTIGESYDLICSDHPINHAEGVLSVALGSGSSATEANQFVAGTYNEETDSLFIVGNGSSEATRANAFEVTPDGKAIVGAATEDSDDDETLVTKGYADSSYLAKTRTITIDINDWENASYSHSLSPITVGADDVLFVTPADECAQEYYSCGIQRIVQGGTTLVLSYTTAPQHPITVQIVYLKGQAF